jgi:hypothetical protein
LWGFIKVKGKEAPVVHCPKTILLAPAKNRIKEISRK